MCCSSDAKWKNEVYPEHTFDFIDVREFRNDGCSMHFKYIWLYVLVLKSFLVYISDIFSVTIMLTTSEWSNSTFARCQKLGCFFIPFEIGKWLFVGCIVFSFLLLAYESRKARIIIASRNISHAFTNEVASNYYCLKSYDVFCFFDNIVSNQKKKDDFAFFVLFAFKSWKRLIFADAPRQVINSLTLYSIYVAHRSDTKDAQWWDITGYFNNLNLATSALIVSTFFTVLVFAGSMILLIIAVICYIPLFFHIRGNLKEYCCLKIDKRIDTFIKKRNKQRAAKAARLAELDASGYNASKDKEFLGDPAEQPTLPQLYIDDHDLDGGSNAPGVSEYNYAPSHSGHGHGMNYPPSTQYGYHSNLSAPSFNDIDSYYDYKYDEEGESHANLRDSAAPIAGQEDVERYGSDRHQASPSPYYKTPTTADRLVRPAAAPVDRYASPAPYFSQTMAAPTLKRSNSYDPHHPERYTEEDAYGGHEEMESAQTPAPSDRSRRPYQDPLHLNTQATHQRDDSYQFEPHEELRWRKKKDSVDHRGPSAGAGFAL